MSNINLEDHHPSPQQPKPQDPSKSFFSIEEELGEEYEDAPLTWRGSPSTTLSDCTLVLTNNESEGEKATYHVHRAVLGASDRRCLFFMKASQKNVSQIDICFEFKAAQDVFPVMLDYVYFGDLHIHTENAEALRHLSEFLQCRPLRQAVNKFIENDFSISTAIHYVCETSHFHDHALLEVTIRETAKLFGKIDLAAFTVLPPDLFAAIVSNKHMQCDDQEEKLSQTIQHYFYANPRHLSAKLLVHLTSLIPSIKPTEARGFLELVERLDPPPISDAKAWADLTPLCIHCSNAIAPMVWRDDEVKVQDDYFFNGKWSGDGASRLFITRLVSSLSYAREQCKLQKQVTDRLQDTMTESQNQVVELSQKVSELQNEREVAEAAAAATASTKGDTESAEARDDIAASNYNDVCRELAMNLSQKLNEKERLVQDLESELELKESELDRMGQMMVHLNARLKFYEILHNEDNSPINNNNITTTNNINSMRPPSPRKSIRDAALRSVSPRKSITTSSNKISTFTVPTTPTSSTSTRSAAMQQFSPSSSQQQQQMKSLGGGGIPRQSTRPETPIRLTAAQRLAYLQQSME
jgi:BTB/POZ domain